MRTSWVRSLVQHPRARFMRRSLRRMFLGIWSNFLLMPYIASVPANAPYGRCEQNINDMGSLGKTL